MENKSKNSAKAKMLSQMNGENLYITPADILFSLQPLIAAYFEGICKCDGVKLVYTAANGQIFQISAAEVTKPMS